MAKAPEMSLATQQMLPAYLVSILPIGTWTFLLVNSGSANRQHSVNGLPPNTTVSQRSF
jgi:hypothetical protein